LLRASAVLPCLPKKSASINNQASRVNDPRTAFTILPRLVAFRA
jgi:hypothetical protein